MKKLYSTILLLFIFSLLASAQDSNVTVIGSGDGNSKTNAVNQALRNCIEKSMGAFLSSSTNISNDSLVKDEIVTIASGTIVSYDILSEFNKNENWNVSVSAIISPEQLVTTLKTKGYNFELNGGVYAQNILKEKFYSEQETKALENFYSIWKNIALFEFDIEVLEPKVINGNFPAEVEGYVTLNRSGPEMQESLNSKLNEKLKIILQSFTNNSIAMLPSYYNGIGYGWNVYDTRINSKAYYELIENVTKKELKYVMPIIFTPKITSAYIKFVENYLNLLYSISIKNFESYKSLNDNYFYISVTNPELNEFNDSKYTNLHLRNKDDIQIMDRIANKVESESTGKYYLSGQLSNLKEETKILARCCNGVGDGLSFRFSWGNNPYTISPFLNNLLGNTFSFLPSVRLAFLTFQELQDLKKIEFKSELASVSSESVNKEPTPEDTKKKEKEFASAQLSAMIDSMNLKTTDKNEMIYKTEELTVKPDQDKEKFIEYYSKNIKYPAEAKEKNISGNVLVSYIIEKDGRITNTKVVKSVGGGCDEEAIRFISSMPKCTPAEKDGKKVRVMKIGAFNCSPN